MQDRFSRRVTVQRLPVAFLPESNRDPLHFLPRDLPLPPVIEDRSDRGAREIRGRRMAMCPSMSTHQGLKSDREVEERGDAEIVQQDGSVAESSREMISGIVIVALEVAAVDGDIHVGTIPVMIEAGPRAGDAGALLEVVSTHVIVRQFATEREKLRFTEIVNRRRIVASQQGHNVCDGSDQRHSF